MHDVLTRGRHFGEVRCEAVIEGFTLGLWFARTLGEEVKPHGHDEAHFMFAFSGAYASEAGGETGKHPGQLIFNPPQTYHRDHFETAGIFISVGISRDVWEAIRSDGLPAQPQNIPALRPRMAAARVMRELAEWDEASALNCEALCIDMLGGVLSRSTVDRRRPAWLDVACDLLRDGHAAGPRLSKIAAAIGVHPHHLTRTFRAFEGCTPGEYRLAVRLEAATRLIIDGRASLAEVALATGFSDQSHFARRFRAAYGFTPGEYRRRTGVRRCSHVCFRQDR